MSHIFISHSTRDGAELARALVAALENGGQRCWCAPRDVKGGVSYPSAIVRAIRESAGVVVLLTPGANESTDVLQEVKLAHDERRPLVPLIIRGTRPCDALSYFLGVRHQIHWTAAPETAAALRAAFAPATVAPSHSGAPRPRTSEPPPRPKTGELHARSFEPVHPRSRATPRAGPAGPSRPAAPGERPASATSFTRRALERLPPLNRKAAGVAVLVLLAVAGANALFGGRFAGALDARQMVARGISYELGTGGNTRSYAQAVYWYERAANLGNAQAEGRLGRMYSYGLGGLSRDESEALQWFKKAAEQGDGVGENGMGVAYQNGYGGLATSEKEAARWFTKAANHGNAAAQSSLAEMYRIGSGGLEQSEKVAEQWLVRAVEGFRKLADQGDIEAQNSLGTLYENGRGGLVKSDKQAVHWYTLAAQQGNAYAQNRLGDIYANGREGIPQDEQQAVHWYTQGAESGNAEAQNSLGFMYEKGRGGLAKSDTDAVRWFTKAADHGLATAEYNVGIMYAEGRGGLTQNDAAAVRWYTKAAEQDFVAAESALGFMYENGRGGLAHNEDEAIRLYRKAALQGFSAAQDNLKKKGLSWQPRARLGVDGQDLTRDMAESAGLPLPDGAWVSQITPGSAAQRVGLKPGDVILKVNGESITRFDDLLVDVGFLDPDNSVTLEVLRNHRTYRISVKLDSVGT